MLRLKARSLHVVVVFKAAMVISLLVRLVIKDFAFNFKLTVRVIMPPSD